VYARRQHGGGDDGGSGPGGGDDHTDASNGASDGRRHDDIPRPRGPQARRELVGVGRCPAPHPDAPQRTDGIDGRHLGVGLAAGAQDGELVGVGPGQGVRGDAGHGRGAQLTEGEGFDHGHEHARAGVPQDQ
jgi:hypothetical protein